MRHLGALTLLLWAGVAAAEAPQVLVPTADSRLTDPEGWLVVRAEQPPPVTLDGKPLAVRVSQDGVHHYLLTPLRDGVGTLQVGDGASLHVGGGRVGFHQTTAATCWECHDNGDAGCGECHPTPQESKHLPVLAKGCLRCHVGPGRSADEVQTLCVGCHPDYAGKRHGRIRHAVLSARDPQRPERAMNCASCHDPHAPRCLSCLPRGELRAWCKNCHGGP